MDDTSDIIGVRRLATNAASGERPLAARLLIPMCVLALATVLVRLPSASLVDASNEERLAYTTSSGMPYFTDQDSYYHARLVQNHMAQGQLGNAYAANGESWDTQSFCPEGRSAEYPPGMMWLTESLWFVLHPCFGITLEQLEFCMPVLISAVVAMLTWALGTRMSGSVGGLVAGVLVGCAPGFVLRSVFGRYDTDALVILMDVLLSLLLCEALRARNTRNKAIMFGGFLLAAWLYSLCWTPQHAALYVAALLLGALLFAILTEWLASRSSDAQGARACFGKDLVMVLLCVVGGMCACLIVYGPGFAVDALHVAAGTVDFGSSNVMPSVLVSVAEMRVPRMAPEIGMRWFVGDMLRGDASILEGTGGLVAVLLAGMALVLLMMRFFGKRNVGAMPLEPRACGIYVCVLGVQAVVGLYLSMRGVRFIEHLAVPIGVLAGVGTTWIMRLVQSNRRMPQSVRTALIIALCPIAMIPSLAGSYAVSTRTWPSVTNAHAHAMQWVHNNASDPNAAIVSWWDMGYFYEYESGHPCLWDGGTLNGTRAMLVAKALVAQDSEFSTAMLRMLAASGNHPADFLMEHTDAHTAFAALCDAVTLEEGEAQTMLQERCGLTRKEAKEAEELIHPREPQELYLVLSSEMLLRLGWYEYYADWDFSGNATRPMATAFNKAWDGAPIQETTEGKKLLQRRSGETIWRLLVDGEMKGSFTSVFDEDDGVSHVRVWRIS